MATSSRIVFILHGRHRPQGLPEHLLAPLRADFDVDILMTSSADSATRYAREAALSGARWVVAVGGDGTVHEVVNGLMSVPEAARRDVALAVLPTGTGNDFVRSLGSGDSLPGLPGLIGLMAAGQVHALDLIRVTLADGSVRWCNNIGSIGITSDIVRRVKAMPARLPASLAFYSAVSTALLRWQPQPMRLTLDGELIEGRFTCVSAANGRFFGSGLGIAPEAQLDDGLMEVVLIANAGSLDFIRLLPQLRQAQRLTDPRVRYLRGRVLQVEGEPARCPLELDGELAGHAPVRFELVPGALRCLRRQQG
ncbi:diacylglycerol/lipid kinase family protein [Vogesella mureinivorans]|uniref:diacylglycerol/lipid kinase family protein n=1 Tax=Vogesella mureinivorans TaxID=657276 RepID=UPI0014787158|nr:diacylglycerol kinase family protein [Vogesella mureinivorans]